MKDIALVIPSRIGSTRLANKPLVKIGDLTMIQRVILAAKSTAIEAIYVATDTQEIADLAKSSGVQAILTDSGYTTGTDRVFAASKIANLPHKVIVNLQGDMPFIDPQVIEQVALMALNTSYDITTAVAPMPFEYAQSSSNVKVVIDSSSKALYFSRALIPHLAESYLCHIGVYAFKRPALERFCSLPIAKIEKAESLEQLRALYHGMSIGAYIAKDVPISVDTLDDLEKVRLFFLQNTN